MPTKKPSDYLASRIKDIRDHLNMNQMYVPWIWLSIGSPDDKSGNQAFTIDTATKKNFFVSLQNIKTGNGYANNTTIVLAYIPSAEINIMDNCGSDINFLDKVLASAYGKEITFQYGYTYPDIKSGIYKMIISKTSVQIQNAVLIYTITATSSLVRYGEASISVKPFTNKKPTEAFKEVYKQYLKQEGYDLVFKDGVEGSDKLVENIPGCERVSIFQYLQEILGYSVYDKDTEKTKDNERSTYNYHVSDQTNDRAIYVDRTCQNKIAKNSSSTNIIFDWMNGKDDIVIDFNTEFNSQIITASTYAKEFSKMNIFNLDEEGKARVYYGTSSPETGTKTKFDYSYERNLWSEAVNTSYKAQLSTIGIPVEFDLVNDQIQVIPLIYGKAHHTQGVYQILKMTDTIDSSGFTTTFELFKLMSDEIKELYKTGYDKDAIAKAKAAGVYVANKRQVKDGTQYGITSSGSIYNGSAKGDRAKLLQVAAKEMGQTSGAKYWNYTVGGGFSDGNSTPWCACFVSWCLNEAGMSLTKSAGCAQFKSYFEGKNQWQLGRAHGGNYTPNPGDILIFNWSGINGGSCDHIGIVKSCDGQTVNTYEGNTSDMCAERNYSISSANIIGYGVY